MDDEYYMGLAIKKAQDGLRSGQTPFGACIVKDGKVVSCEHNVVWKTHDITAHGEIHAIRVACKNLNSIDLSGCTIYSTTEPCPMCFSAIHWARIERIVYGADIKDAEAAGFNELKISNNKMKSLGKSRIEIKKGVLKKECADLFKLNRKIY